MKRTNNFPLRNISWIKIGGKAKEYIEVNTKEEFISIVKELRSKNQEFKILGWGANTLISDNDIDFVVIKNLSKEFTIEGVTNTTDEEQQQNGVEEQKEIDARLQTTEKGTFRGIEFKDLDYKEDDKKQVSVIFDSGISLPQAINLSISKGLTGLQWFSGIPGQLGSSVYNNIHGGTHLFSEYVESINVIDSEGSIKKYTNEELKFGYDDSILHNTNEIITDITLKLRLGDKAKAEYTSKEWAKRKISQPKNSLGSVFKNLSKEDQTRLNFPTPSIGYLVEHQLKLSGYKVGGAMIAPTSNNFIVNTGNCTSDDYIQVIKKIKKEAFNQYNLKLIPEIFFWGFSKDELSDVLN